MRKTLLAILSFVVLTMSAQYKSEVWSPDNGDGTFTNPVINADYSDPDVCVGASGEDFYLTASSFNCIPGLPILHSKDLVNWEIINYAIELCHLWNAIMCHSMGMECGHRLSVITSIIRPIIYIGETPIWVSLSSQPKTLPGNGLSPSVLSRARV